MFNKKNYFQSKIIIPNASQNIIVCNPQKNTPFFQAILEEQLILNKGQKQLEFWEAELMNFDIISTLCATDLKRQVINVDNTIRSIVLTPVDASYQNHNVVIQLNLVPNFNKTYDLVLRIGDLSITKSTLNTNLLYAHTRGF